MTTDPSDPFKPCWHCGSAEHVTADHPQGKKPLLPVTAKELIEAHEKLDDKTFLWAMRRLPEHEKDLLVVCPVRMCSAAEGEECKHARMNRRQSREEKALRKKIFGSDKTVHIGRRVRRLLKGIR